MGIACWVPKAINTLSECVKFIPFPQYQWFQGRASMLCYTYSACLVNNKYGAHTVGVEETQTLLNHLVNQKCGELPYEKATSYC